MSGFEETVLSWPHVSAKKMFGHHCYKANGKLFAFLVTDGVVITKLAEADRETLSRQFRATSFQSGGRTIRDWVKLSVKNERDLENIMPYMKRSYESTIESMDK